MQKSNLEGAGKKKEGKEKEKASYCVWLLLFIPLSMNKQLDLL